VFDEYALDTERRELRRNGDLAYDLYLQGLDHWNRWTREGNAESLKLFYAAMEKDHDFSTPYGLAASCYLLAKANDWRPHFDEKEIAQVVERAADIGTSDPVALCWAGHAHAYFFEDVDRALLLIDRALELDENLAIAWQRSGWVRGYAGEPDRAIESLNKAIRLNPLDPRVFLTQSAMSFAHFIAARDDEAAGWAALALRVKPNWLPALRVAVASNAMRGNGDETDRLLKLYSRLDPEVTITKVCGFYPLRRAADRQRLILAMRTAGMPE
jgi:tetratricopeptide (TPR) repeat protein